MTDHDNAPGQSAEEYGKHSQAHARGPSALDLLLRFVRAGQAIRLAWPTGKAAIDEPDEFPEFPTAVLPVIREEPAAGEPTPAAARHGGDEITMDDVDLDVDVDADADTEPATSTREARRWLTPSYRLRWPRSLPAWQDAGRACWVASPLIECALTYPSPGTASGGTTSVGGPTAAIGQDTAGGP